MSDTARAVNRSAMQVSDEIAIQITNMNKWYGTFHVLRYIDLTVQRCERIVIAGPSGSGKSTLIRCINRLEEHQSGQIIVVVLDRLQPRLQAPTTTDRGAVPEWAEPPAPSASAPVGCAPSNDLS